MDPARSQCGFRDAVDFLGQNWIFLNLFPGLLVGPGLGGSG